MQAKFYIQPLKTWQVIERFAKIAAPFASEENISMHINTGVFDEAVRISSNDANPSNVASSVQAWKKREHVYLNSAHMSFRGGQLYYYAEDHPACFLQLNVDEAHSERKKVLVSAIGDIFDVIPKRVAEAAGMTEPQKAAFRLTQDIIATLSSETAKISSATVEAYGSFLAGVKERTLELERSYAEREESLKAEIAAERVALRDEHSQKLAELETREKLHREEVKQFELRNNTVVRRDLLEKIRTKIEAQKQVEISKGTVRLRWVIHVVCIVTLAASATLIGLLAHKVITQAASDWKLLVPLSSWTALFVMTGIFYLRWNDQWFRDHARVEFENRKLAADILRASWVAELFFEWVEKKGVNMPTELIESFTRDLFQSPALDARLHPADQLQELMKQVSSLEVGKGGFKVTRGDKVSGNGAGG